MSNERLPISTFCLSILCCIKHSAWVLVDQTSHADNMPERYLKRASNQGKQGQQRRYRERSASHLLSFCSLLEQRGGFAVSKLSSLLCGLLWQNQIEAQCDEQVVFHSEDKRVVLVLSD